MDTCQGSAEGNSRHSPQSAHLQSSQMGDRLQQSAKVAIVNKTKGVCSEPCLLSLQVLVCHVCIINLPL